MYGSTTFEGVGFKNSSNLFDVGIVITFVVDAWVLTPLGSSTDLNLLKFLRLIRLVRVIRLIRLLRIFKDLTALVRAPTTSITAISWMCALLLLFTLLFALLLNGVLDILVLDPHTEHYSKYFSKNLKASFTLFQILTGFSSNAHNNVLRPLLTNTAFPWLPYLLFQVYVWVFRYGLITSEVGVFVSNVIAKNEKSSQKKAVVLSLGKS